MIPIHPAIMVIVEMLVQDNHWEHGVEICDRRRLSYRVGFKHKQMYMTQYREARAYQIIARASVHHFIIYN